LDAIIAAYWDLHAQGTNANMWDSITQQYVFIEEILAALDRDGPRIRRVRRLLHALGTAT